MSLTVIVCTMPSRRQLLSRCLWHLEHQTVRPRVIVAHSRNKGKGEKLNFAFGLVETSHVMVCDDDDYLALHHTETVLPHLDNDFVGYDAVQTVMGRYATTIHQETASHICPIRTDLATLVPFDDDYLGDIRWTRAVKPFVKTSTYVDQPLYYYDKWVEGGGWSPTREVGWWPYDKQADHLRWI